jgi:hypothetical protein
LITNWRKLPPAKLATIRTAVNNITRVYRMSQPIEREYGQTWYQTAHKEASKIARRYKLPVKLVCHVIAALSPGVRWDQNVAQARMMIRCFVEGTAPETGYSTYRRNVAKASAMLALHKRGLKWDHIVQGPKTRSFAYNICYPRSINPRVTIDVHAISVCNRYRWTIKAVPGITPATYEDYRKAHVLAARVVGVRPHELQAIVWVTWKRLHRI